MVWMTVPCLLPLLLRIREFIQTVSLKPLSETGWDFNENLRNQFSVLQELSWCSVSINAVLPHDMHELIITPLHFSFSNTSESRLPRVKIKIMFTIKIIHTLNKTEIIKPVQKTSQVTFFSMSMVRMASRRQNSCASSLSGSWSVNMTTIRLFQFFKCCIGLCSGFNCSSVNRQWHTLLRQWAISADSRLEAQLRNRSKRQHVSLSMWLDQVSRQLLASI